MDKPLRKKPPKTALRTRRRVPISRRVVIVVTGLVLTAILGLLGYHQYEWVQSTKRAQAGYEAAAGQIRNRLTDRDINPETIKEISSLAATTASGLCASPFLGDIRTHWLESARQQQEQCQDTAKKLQQVSLAASQVRSWLDVEQELASIYGQVQDSLAEIDTSDYLEQQKLWRDVESKVDSVELSDQLYADHKLAQLEAVGEIISSYDALIKADKDNKRPEFDAALKKLQKSYDGLSEVIEGIKVGYGGYAKALGAAVQSL